MIILITCKDERGNLIVSHGVDEDTLKDIILPQEHPLDLGAKFNRDLMEWVLE